MSEVHYIADPLGERERRALETDPSRGRFRGNVGGEDATSTLKSSAYW